jgi:hypothetical protein
MPNPIQQPVDLSIRPSVRVLGALLTAAIACLFFYDGLALFTVQGVFAASCQPGKWRWLCELVPWLVAALPASIQNPMMGMVGLVLGGILLLVTWLLIRPLFPRAGKSVNVSSRKD